jgi:hypothetical protein
MTTEADAAATMRPIMSQSFTPRPQHQSSSSAGSGSHFVLWTFLLGVAFWPRLWILAYWIFGRQLGDAYSSWIIPALGFLFLPWTTLLYAWMWAIGSDGLHGWEWLPVVFSFLVDIWFWSAARRSFRD